MYFGRRWIHNVAFAQQMTNKYWWQYVMNDWWLWIIQSHRLYMCCIPEGSPYNVIQNLVIGIRIVWFSINRLLDDKYNLKNQTCTDIIICLYFILIIWYNAIFQWFLIPNSTNEIILLAFSPIIPHYVSILHYGIVVIVWWKKNFRK